jgi:hypothetical protein
MTTFEMQQLFETLLQTSSSLFNDSEKPDTDTIFRFLNEAQIKYIKEKYLSAPTFYERTRVIGNNLNDLKNLIYIISLTEITTTPYFPNTLLFKSTTQDVWHYLGVTGRVTRTYPYAVNTALIDLVPIEAEEVNSYITTAINKPIIHIPVFTQTHSQVTESIDNRLSLLVIYDSFTTYSADGTQAHCLLKPHNLVLEVNDPLTEVTYCQLADYLHEDIVRLAVELFEQQKYKLVGKSKEPN